MKQPKWTHIVELGPTHHIYCYEQGDNLRAVGDNQFAPGQTLCVWGGGDEGGWQRDGRSMGDYIRTRYQCKQRTTQPSPHKFIMWGPNLDETLILPYLVCKDAKGGETIAEIPHSRSKTDAR